MDPLDDYTPLPLTPYPSAPASVIISISPVPRTIREVVPVVEQRVNYRWLSYCLFIVFVFIVAVIVFCYMIYGDRKN